MKIKILPSFILLVLAAGVLFNGLIAHSHDSFTQRLEAAENNAPVNPCSYKEQNSNGAGENISNTYPSIMHVDL